MNINKALFTKCIYIIIRTYMIEIRCFTTHAQEREIEAMLS